MPEDLPEKVAPRIEPVLADGKVLPLKEAMKQWERRVLLESLRSFQGNRKETPRGLGINRTTLYNKMRVHGITDV